MGKFLLQRRYFLRRHAGEISDLLWSLRQDGANGKSTDIFFVANLVRNSKANALLTQFLMAVPCKRVGQLRVQIATSAFRSSAKDAARQDMLLIRSVFNIVMFGDWVPEDPYFVLTRHLDSWSPI